jgi:hypothetical protein
MPVVPIETQDNFLGFITPANLYLAAAVFLSATALFTAMAYALQYDKKKRAASRKRISEQLNEWIGEAMVEGSVVIVRMTPHIKRLFTKREHRQYIIDSLINVKKNIIGSASDNIKDLYVHLGLKADSVKKISLVAPHLKARGIYELFMMEERDMLPAIEKYTNSPNELVRMEAQTAQVGFAGFEGLKFLNTLTFPINEWQQLKLLEQLKAFNAEDMNDMPGWLRSPNKSVVVFALKLAQIYQQFHIHDDVVACLADEQEKVRRYAITTLGKIANEHTPAIFRKQYVNETRENKIAILRELSVIGGPDDIPFLKEQLQNDDAGLKLEAARSIARGSANGFNDLLLAAGDNEILQAIGKQVKYEVRA